MASNPEALAQLARLLADERLRVASRDEARAAVDRDFDQMVEGLLHEVSASDDVVDRASGLEFLDARLAYFGDLLSEEQRARLSRAVGARIETW